MHQYSDSCLSSMVFLSIDKRINYLVDNKGDFTMATLADMQPGDLGRVCGFSGGDVVYRQKLLSMGLTPNTYFEVIRRAPLGDPIQIRVHAYFLSLRQAEAALLKIERVDK